MTHHNQVTSKSQTILRFFEYMEELENVKRDLMNYFLLVRSPDGADNTLVSDLEHFKGEVWDLKRRLELVLDTHDVYEGMESAKMKIDPDNHTPF